MIHHGDTQAHNIGKGHCPKLCSQMHKIGDTLGHLMQEIKERGVGLQAGISRKQANRKIPVEYAKVTETVNRVDGIEVSRVMKHYLDDTEMRKALRWDEKEQFQSPRVEFSSKTIKVRHDFQGTKNPIKHDERVEPGENKKSTHSQGGFTLVESPRLRAPTPAPNESPRFNNEFIQMKTQQHHNLNQFPHTIPDDSKPNPPPSSKRPHPQKYHIKRLISSSKIHDYIYKKKTTTKYSFDSENSSSNSTDSEFSRFQL